MALFLYNSSILSLLFIDPSSLYKRKNIQKKTCSNILKKKKRYKIQKKFKNKNDIFLDVKLNMKNQFYSAHLLLNKARTLK